MWFSLVGWVFSVMSVMVWIFSFCVIGWVRFFLRMWILCGGL